MRQRAGGVLRAGLFSVGFASSDRTPFWVAEWLSRIKLPQVTQSLWGESSVDHDDQSQAVPAGRAVL